MTDQKKTRHRISPPTPDEVRAAREALGLTPTEAAAEAGVIYPTWWKWETGATQMPYATHKMFLLLKKIDDLQKIITKTNKNIIEK